MQRLAAGLAVLILVAVACGPAPGAPSGPPTAEVDPTVATTASASSSPAAREPLALEGEPLEPCGIGFGAAIQALCGRLDRPEVPDHPAGRRIAIRVAVIPAASTVPEPDPVFMLAGGPGGAATQALAWTAGTFRGIHATRDIVLVDQRGTGGSNAMWVGEAPDLDGLSAEEIDATVRDWVAGELARFDSDPRFYTTSLAMDDLDAVRAALGYERINLYGPSYGATAAQYYLRQHGDRVRAVVLDGGTLLDVPIFELIAPNSQRALDLLFDRCMAQRSCATAFPDLPGSLERALEALSSRPVETRVVDPVTGDAVVLDGPTLTGAIHVALLNAATSAAIPMVIAAAADGRWEEVAGAIVAARAGAAPESGMPVMSAIIRCSEAWARQDPAEVARRGQGSYLVEAQVELAIAQAAACRYAPAGVVRPDDAEAIRSDLPVLLLVGGADPQDPPANVAGAPHDFPNSLTLVAEGHGHTIGHLGCLPGVVDAFVGAGTVAGLDVSCVAGSGVPLAPFRLPPS